MAGQKVQAGNGAVSQPNNNGGRMNTPASAMHRLIVRLALTVIGLLPALNLSAQTLRVTAANSSAPNAAYDVLFSAAETTLLNADGSSFHSFHSLVFVPNTASGGVDLLVADTVGGSIVRYFGPTGTPLVTSTVVWSGVGSGPRRPDGLSVDAAGNLYVVSSVGGAHGPQLWVLPVTPITSSTPTGYLAPVLLDQNFNGNEVDSLVESVVVPNPTTATAQTAYTNAGIKPGDLLVLRSDNDFLTDDGGKYDPHEPALVYDYPVASIQRAISCYATTPAASCTISPTILLWERQFPYPSGAQPNGLDIWPIDGSLLISTSLGTILQYALPIAATNTLPPTWTSSYEKFASVSCGKACPFYKLRTSIQAAIPYAFVTQSTGPASGNILEFAGPTIPSGGFTAATAITATGSATAGSPEGLAVAPPGLDVLASTTTCTSSTGCNPTGALSHLIAGPAANSVSGNILEQTCIITDTRKQANGSCPGSLNIAKLCPGFPANTIPPTMCGASGQQGNQLAVILSIANGVDDHPDLLVQSQQSPASIIPNTTNPACTQQVMGWTTRLGSTEGTEPEGSDLIDMTGYCDGGGATTKGNSIWLLGGQLSPTVSANTRDLVGYAAQKLIHLGETIEAANIASPAKWQLGACLFDSAILLETRQYDCAARVVYECDQLVADTEKSYGSSTRNPNPYGDVRGRLGSLFFTINSRILQRPPNTLWPLPPGETPPACHR
jgi:hypothetical protein